MTNMTNMTNMTKNTNILGWMTISLSKALGLLSVLILLFLIASLTWRIIMFIFFNENDNTYASLNQLISQISEKNDDEKLREIVNGLNMMSIFGELPQNKLNTNRNEQIANRPKTTLPMKLNGLLVSSDPLKSMAIIDYQKKQGSYLIGDEITKGVSVVNIQDIGVLIDENGVQTLLSYNNVSNNTSTKNNNADDKSTSNKSNSEIDANLREELLASPQKLLDYVSISPVKEEDKLVGYRVNPGENAKLFEELGFMPGDIAVEINGVDLTNELESLSLLAEINTLTYASIHVKRNNEVHIIDVNLAQ